MAGRGLAHLRRKRDRLEAENDRLRGEVAVLRSAAWRVLGSAWYGQDEVTVDPDALDVLEAVLGAGVSRSGAG
jgi:hypothetical protein